MLLSFRLSERGLTLFAAFRFFDKEGDSNDDDVDVDVDDDDDGPFTFAFAFVLDGSTVAVGWVGAGLWGLGEESSLCLVCPKRLLVKRP